MAKKRFPVNSTSGSLAYFSNFITDHFIKDESDKKLFTLGAYIVGGGCLAPDILEEFKDKIPPNIQELVKKGVQPAKEFGLGLMVLALFGNGTRGFNSTEDEYQYEDIKGTAQQLWDALKDAEGEPEREPIDHPPPRLRDFLDVLKALFDKAKQASSPLILDLDGDGVETLGQDAGVFFDHDANGFAQLSGWVAPNDGLLVWDWNGNGQIDDGSELFGNNSLLENGQKAVNGFAALAELDKNGDGVLDANDAAFAALRVWRDKNSDGKVGEGELLTLDELGIQSLCTSYTVQQVVDANGNALRQQGSFTYVNGSTGQMGDVWFTEDTARSLPTERVEVPEEIAALPDVMAFGNVYSLHQAMARDESGALRTLVEEFAWADGYLTVGLPAAA